MTAARARLTLAIETSNPSARAGEEGGGGPGVALGVVRGRWDVEVLAVEPLAPTARHDDDLMPAIDRLFARAGAERRTVERVAVSVGPGGYTALRIAVATGKMLCEALGARCVGVPSAQVAARRVDAAGRRFAVALASKGSTAHVTVFDEGGRAADGGALIGAEGVEGLGVGVLAADRFLPEGMRAEAQRLGIEVRPPVLDPAACFEASLGLAEIEADALLPVYAREPEAVTLWRKRRGSGES